MRNLILGLFVALLPLTAIADTLLVSPEASYANGGAGVPENIKNECGLPAAQTQAVLNALNASGITAQVAAGDAIPKQGRVVQLNIESAISAGNAFIGHRKQVVTSARLFVNGKETAKQTFTRDSGGGVFAGYKGSCSVLYRCTTTLGKDIASWVQSQ